MAMLAVLATLACLLPPLRHTAVRARPPALRISCSEASELNTDATLGKRVVLLPSRLLGRVIDAPARWRARLGGERKSDSVRFTPAATRGLVVPTATDVAETIDGAEAA